MNTDIVPFEGPPDPTLAPKEKAVAIVQEKGVTVVVGDRKQEEWIATGDMGPLTVSDYR